MQMTDTELRDLAKKRVDFRRHLMVYIVFNTSLWLIWWFTGHGYIWPIWPLVGWGVGLLFHYLFEYRPQKYFSEEEEYRKLKSNEEW